MAFEVPDARRGRAVAKAVLDTDGGISHRGGPVLGAARRTDCPARSIRPPPRRSA
jgi:hypothetical protein